MRAPLEIYSDSEALIRAEAERVVARARDGIAARGRFTLALAGGTTPRRLYELLATPAMAARIEWSRVHVFWGDERCVPPAHSDSNYRMGHEALLAHVPVPAENVHRMAGEDPPEQAAAAYEAMLRASFGDAPTFDLVHLGMGEDGHTASLFPGAPALDEQRRWVRAVHAANVVPPWRITLTLVALEHARQVTLLVTGAAKAARVAEALEGGGQGLPVQRLRGAVSWMIDAAAASRLRRSA